MRKVMSLVEVREAVKWANLKIKAGPRVGITQWHVLGVLSMQAPEWVSVDTLTKRLRYTGITGQPRVVLRTLAKRGLIRVSGVSLEDPTGPVTRARITEAGQRALGPDTATAESSRIRALHR